MSSLERPPVHPKYRRDIDGLRAIAVLSVVAFHAFPGLMPGGFIGVDVFFVISGFLISTIIFENLDRGTFSFRDFYARRIKRIFPALLLVLLTGLVLGWVLLLPYQFKALGKHIVAGAGFVSNFVLWSEAGYFDNSAETKPLLHLWSLGIEEQFYIVWPLLLWLAWKLRFNFLMLTLALALGSFVLNLYGVKRDPVASFYTPLNRFWELLAGGLLAWAGLYGQATRAGAALAGLRLRHGASRLPDLLALLGLVLLVYGFWRINKGFSFPGEWAVVPVLGSVLLIVAGPGAWVNRRLLSNRLLVGFGLISFPLYLWHWPLLAFARIVKDDLPDAGIRLAIVALSVALAMLTYRLLEKRIRPAGKNRIKVGSLAVVMVVVAGLGYSVYVRDGLPSRSQLLKGLSADNMSNRLPANYDSESWIDYKPVASLNGQDCVSTKASLCRMSDFPGAKRMLLVGDSHSVDYSMEFRDYLQRKKRNGWEISMGGCAFIPKHAAINHGECAKARELLLRAVDEQKIDSVIFVAGLNNHIENLSEAELGLNLDALTELLSELLGKGVTVIYFSPRPYFRADPPRYARQGRLAELQAVISPNAVVLSESIAALTRQRNFLLFDQEQVLLQAGCGKLACFNGHTAELMPLYRDSNHLTTRGARLVFQRFADGPGQAD